MRGRRASLRASRATASGSKGEVLLRIGLPPKRAIPLRTNAPFKKIVVALIAPNSKPGDKPQKIEVLGDGQQIAVAGIHPDTRMYGETVGRQSTRCGISFRLLTRLGLKQLHDIVVGGDGGRYFPTLPLSASSG